MKIKEINSDFLINRILKTDPHFKGNYTIDPYQNCEFGCIYCDSASDDTIYIKQNALELLQNELKSIPKGRIIIGSVHDPYQPIEKKYSLTRSIIKILIQHSFPIHILTKSPLVLRDLDLLKNHKNIMVTFSLISLSPEVNIIFEKDSPSVINRFKSIQNLTDNKVLSGIALIPILPGFIDKSLEKMIISAKRYHASYFIFKHLFLKGDQKTLFLMYIKKYYPDFFPLYRSLFKYNIYPPMDYQKKINKQIRDICERYNIPNHI
jgi:DNA repair photolyase